MISSACIDSGPLFADSTKEQPVTRQEGEHMLQDAGIAEWVHCSYPFVLGKNRASFLKAHSTVAAAAHDDAAHSRNTRLDLNILQKCSAFKVVGLALQVGQRIELANGWT
eukprot:16059-Heterococcus_DN1.PRE.2